MNDDDSDQLPDKEIARRMELGLRRALNTLPQPHGKNPKGNPPIKRKPHSSTNVLEVDRIGVRLPLKPSSP
jgi:hypothetical protein